MSAPTTADLKPYHYPEQYRHLLEQTGNHEMRVLHQDGAYRHLRFQAPGTGMWHWDLITWPGSLAIRGDIGEGYIFTREPDMLGFFDHGQPDGHINPQYWAEKLDRGCRSVEEFSSDKFVKWLSEQHQVPNTGYDRAALIDDARGVLTVDAAIDLCNDADIAWDCDDPETWMDYRYHFILALHAILWGAKKYHAEADRA